jgi:hypothetical protein
MKPGFFYFCHPYSAKTIEGRTANYELACRRSAKLLLAGYNIFSPIVHSHLIEIASPEMLKWSIDKRWQFWIDIDMAVLEYVGFTGAVFAPGWGQSKGCKKEYEWFLAHKQPNGKPHDILLYSKIAGD